MCIALPLKVDSIENNIALCSRDGVQSKVHLGLLKNVQAGDYVLVHTGFALQKVSQEEALAMIRDQKELMSLLEESP